MARLRAESHPKALQQQRDGPTYQNPSPQPFAALPADQIPRSEKKPVTNFFRKIRLLALQLELPIQTSTSLNDLLRVVSDLHNR